MTGSRFYPNSDTQHYYLMRLNDFVVNLKKYRRCIMWSWVIGIVVSVPMFSWLWSDHVLKNSIDMTKNVINIVLQFLFPSTSLYTSWPTKYALACNQQEGFYFTRHFCFLYFWIHVSQISQISTICTKLLKPSISNNIWPHISDLKLDHIIYLFWLRTWLIFCFFSYVEIFHLLWRREGVGIYRKLIINWIE